MRKLKKLKKMRKLGELKFAALVLLLISPGLFAAEKSSRPRAMAHHFAVKPKLDGNVIDDPAWRGAPVMSKFWQVRPVEGAPASQKTEVFVGFTEDTLYIGAICYDNFPEGIIVNDSRRDADLEDTDSFQVILDSFKDLQNGFVFGTNPAGIEYDGQVTKGGTGQFGSGSGGFNLNWDTSWKVKTEISEIGWSVEMAIPFKSLRYGSEDVQTWGINFQRNIRRNNEIVYWAPLGRQHNLYRISDAGSIEGIHVPAQRNLKFTPYGLVKEGKGGVQGRTSDSEAGFDIKYSITPSLTMDLTYNTDFAQVEVDELQVNLDRFNLFLPEQRPFFLENADQFKVGVPRAVELFFSRKIGIGPDGVPIPIVGGVRLSGKLGNSTNVGFLQMRSEKVTGVAPENDFTVVRANKEFANRSSLGAIFVNRDGDGSILGDEGDDYNRTYGIDGRLGLGDNGELSGYVAQTKTPDLSGKDHSFRIRGDYNSENWTSRIHYTEVGEDFNPEVGFLTRRDFRQLEVFAMRRYRPADWGGILELRPHIAYRTFRNFDGFHETTFVHADNHWEWKSGFEIHTGMNFFHEGVQTPFEIVDGVIVSAGHYDDYEVALVLITDQSAPLSYRLSTRVGGLFGGDRVGIEQTIRYRIGDKFTSEVSWDHNDIDLGPDKAFKVDVGILRLSYSFTPKISLQALVQYNKQAELLATNVRFAWLVSADTGLYVVYNEIDDDSFGASPRREFTLKYSYLFDLFR
jgi:hypothetical protein